MKKVFIIWLLSFYALSATELREVLKLPVLFQHFYEHKALNQDTTIISFLVEHYSSIPHTDDDEERDNQLPFKSIDFGHHNLSVAIPGSTFVIKKIVRQLSVNTPNFYKENFPLLAYTGKIWQPPKV